MRVLVCCVVLGCVQMNRFMRGLVCLLLSYAPMQPDMCG